VDEDRFGGLTATEATAEALGATRRVIITHSPAFHERQSRGFDQTLAKAGRQPVSGRSTAGGLAGSVGPA
jgi:hypothetical protein